MNNDEDFRQEVRDGFKSLREDIKDLARQTAETNTTIVMRGGVIDRLDAAEKGINIIGEKAAETKADLNTIKAKVAFAAACVSALVASVWALFTHFWKNN
mgnify:CR=1 FL=1